MDVEDAAALIAPAVRPPAPVAVPTGAPWADLGAGGGTFTRALARLLGFTARVHAVDRDPAALARSTDRLPARAPGEGSVTAHLADFTEATALDALGWPPLAGVLLANALHFVPAAAQASVLADVLARLAPGGRLIVVEYENRRPSRWVPAPVPFARLAALADEISSERVGVTGRVHAPVRVGTRPSAFGGTMYAAYLERRS